MASQNHPVLLSMFPALETLRTAPTMVLPVGISAPVPSWAMPTFIVPAMLMSAEDPFGFLDEIEPLDRGAETSTNRCVGCRSQQHAADCYGNCRRTRKDQFAHDLLPIMMITNEGRPLENKKLAGSGKVPSVLSSPKTMLDLDNDHLMTSLLA
jgi:hypothetical protein